MLPSIPSLLRLRLLGLRPHLVLTEIHLVDGALLYRCIDARDHVPTEVRAVRPSTADWEALRRVLDTAAFWAWQRRWPPVPDDYEGEFAIAIACAGRAWRSAGSLGVAREVDDVLDEVGRLVGNAPRHASQAVPTLRRGALPPPYRLDVLGGADHVPALPSLR